MIKNVKKICLFIFSIFFLFFSTEKIFAQDTGLPTFGKLAGKSVAIYKNDDGSISSVKDPTTLKDITSLYKFYTDSVTSASAAGKTNTSVDDSSKANAVVSVDASKTTFKTQDGQTIKFTTTDDGQYGITITSKGGVDTTYNSEFRNTTKTTELLNPQQYDDAWIEKQNTRIDEQNAQALRDLQKAALSGDISKLPLVAGATLQNKVVDTTEKGPSYTDDGKKLCTTTECTYTLMAPIGSLLGDKDGKYIIKKSDAKNGLCPLLNSWFRIGIALAGMLAVVMIVLGGFQYATTDSLFDKEEGKGKIQNALWGLLLALTTWLIVSTINPALADCTINANAVQLSAQSTTINTSSGGFSVLSAVDSYGSAADQASIDDKYKKINDQWTDADQEALLSDDPATSKAAADKWSGIQKQLDTLNNSYTSKGGSFSGGSTNRDQAWGSPDATSMNGKSVSGRQTYFSPNEKVTDSDTQAGNGALGKLVEGTSGGKNALGQDLGTGDVVGSAGSVYYPAGTLVEINGIKYVVDDHNLKKNNDGVYVAKNPNVTNNYTVDVFTKNDRYVNTGSDTKKTMTVLYVPTTKVTTAAQISDIRNNPNKYIGK